MEEKTTNEINSNNQKNEILEILNEITFMINKYITDNQENWSLVQMKLSLLLKTAQELLYPPKTNLVPNIKIKKINLFATSYNPHTINTKPLYNIQKKINENLFFSINLNSKTAETLNEKTNSNSDNIYEIIKLKRKLKEEHEKYLLRELAYLERISTVQSQLKKHEKEISSPKFPNISDINSNNISNSSSAMIKNVNKFLDSKMKKNFSCGNLFNSRSKKSNRNNIEFSFFEKNFNLNDFQEHKQHNSIKKLHYKYDVGNSYLKNDFKNIQKVFLKNSRAIRSLKDSYSPTFCIKESENNNKNNKS